MLSKYYLACIDDLALYDEPYPPLLVPKVWATNLAPFRRFLCMDAWTASSAPRL